MNRALALGTLACATGVAYAQNQTPPSILQTPESGALPSQSTSSPSSKPTPEDKPKNYLIGGQITVIPQTLLPFHSPYSGPNSLVAPSTPATVWTDTYTLYLGWRPTPGLELYVDPEMARGAGIGGAVGLGGYPNGDVLRVSGSERFPKPPIWRDTLPACLSRLEKERRPSPQEKIKWEERRLQIDSFYRLERCRLRTYSTRTPIRTAHELNS